MRREYDTIDDACRDKLKDIEISAPVDAWDNISRQIIIVKPNRFAIFYKVAATVAAITVIGSLFWMMSNTNINSERIVSEELTRELKQNLITKPEVAQESALAAQSVDENTIETKEIVQKTHVNNQEIKAYVNNNAGLSDELVAEREETKCDLLRTKNIKINIQQTRNVLADVFFVYNESKIIEPEIDLLLAYTNMEVASKEESKKSKWMIGGDVTPLYSYRNIAKSDAQYGAAYYNSVESPSMTYTGGLNLQYKAMDRLSIQAGVYYTEMGQSLDYMTVYSNKAYEMVAAEYKDRFVNAYEIDNSAGSIRFNTSYVIVDEIAARVNDLSSNKGFVNTADPIFQDIDAEVKQSFKYIEVPVVLRYKLIDRLIDFNIVGGVGANFLIGNDVILSHGNNKEIIGETKGVNTINYTSSLGFGIEYPLMKRLNFRLEPSIKYYLNALNSNSEVEAHPYSIGIYTGINYTF